MSQKAIGLFGGYGNIADQPASCLLQVWLQVKSWGGTLHLVNTNEREENKKVRDWSQNYREGEGLQNGRGGGHVKFYPCENGGGRKKF